MGKHSISFKKSVSRDLKTIPKKDVIRILQRIDELTENPRIQGSITLSGQERYRYTIGKYRILYEIIDRQLIITVVKICHRKDAY